MARVVAPADAAALAERTRRGFAARFGRAATVLSTAPGRANLIGEHTDYNDGLAMPFAVARRTAVAAAPRADALVRVASASSEGVVEFFLREPIGRGAPHWGNYVRGVVAGVLGARAGDGSFLARELPGFDAWIESDVPAGAGLSSSAALEVAMAGALELLGGFALGAVEKAALCRRAEHEWAGVPCGILDQMASVLADGDALLLLDCRDASWRCLPMPAGDVEVLLADSMLPHDLGSGAYAQRVAECREAARLLGVASLRDAAAADLGRLAGVPTLQARARHVVEENERVLAAERAVQAGDWAALGTLLDAGHESLRALYEVSCPGMDDLVARLRRAGALGARMTGGGFGGCAVALFRAGTFDAGAAGCEAG